MDHQSREVLVEVVKQLLAERLAFNHNHHYRKAVGHARMGNISHCKIHLKKLGVDTTRVDAILPLL